MKLHYRLQLTVLLLTIFFPVLMSAQSHQFAMRIGSAADDNSASVDTDADGNFYITGRISDTTDFDPGPGEAWLYPIGADDAFVAKYDPAGNYLWAFNFGGSSYNKGDHIHLDAAGNIYVTGYMQGTVDFDPGSGVASKASKGLYDIFVAKYDADGKYLWAFNVGGPREDFGYTLTTDVAGNVYVLGHFTNLIDLDPGNGTAYHVTKGNYDIFLAKYDANGQFLWSSAFGDRGIDYGFGITTDPNGNVLVTGCFEGAIDFDPGPNVDTLRSAGGADGFAAKYNPNGQYQWSFRWGSGKTDVGYGIVTDETGDLYISGLFEDTCDFDPGNDEAFLYGKGGTDAFLAKYNLDAQFQWANGMGGIGPDNSFALERDADGNLYAGGFFSFDGTFGSEVLHANGLSDIFVAKFDEEGAFQWVYGAGGSGHDDCYGLAMDGTDALSLTGIFHDTMDCHPGAETDYLTSDGRADVFVVKLGTAKVVQIEEESSVRTYNVFPNPGAGLLHIESPDNDAVEVQIFDLNGRLISYWSNISSNEPLLVDHLPAGAYLIVLRTEHLLQREIIILM